MGHTINFEDLITLLEKGINERLNLLFIKYDLSKARDEEDEELDDNPVKNALIMFKHFSQPLLKGKGKGPLSEEEFNAKVAKIIADVTGILGNVEDADADADTVRDTMHYLGETAHINFVETEKEEREKIAKNEAIALVAQQVQNSSSSSSSSSNSSTEENKESADALVQQQGQTFAELSNNYSVTNHLQPAYFKAEERLGTLPQLIPAEEIGHIYTKFQELADRLTIYAKKRNHGYAHPDFRYDYIAEFNAIMNEIDTVNQLLNSFESSNAAKELTIEGYVQQIIEDARTAFAETPSNWPYVHAELLDKQLKLVQWILEKQALDEQQKLEKEMLATSLAIRKAKANKMAAEVNQNVHNDSELKKLRAQREAELTYQNSGRAFAALYGFGQGAYCAGFTAMLIGLNYFMKNALVLAIGWPSLLLLVVALPIFLTSLSNYWMMRKDMGIMAQQAHDKRHKYAIESNHEKTAKEKLSDNYVWAIVTAVLGGILCSTLTAYGIFQLLPGAVGIALPLTFFVITIVPELVLNINHNKKFWAAPIKTMKDAYNNLGEPKYKARFMFWVIASTVGMVFTALALTSLANLVGIPFYISFPVLCAITLSNVSFYFNRAIDYVTRQKEMDKNPGKVNEYTKQLTPGFSLIRLSNAFSNSLVAVIGFLATVASAGLITVHGTADIALANMTSILNFSAPAVILCLSIAVVIGILAGATSYIANSAGIQEGYESVMEEDLRVIDAPITQTVVPGQEPTVSCDFGKPGIVSHWYQSSGLDRYVKDVKEIAGTSIKLTA